MNRMIPLLAALLLVTAACSDDDASSVCEARDELQSSVEDLRDIDVLDDGLDALRSTVDSGGSPAEIATSIGSGVSELVTNWNALADAARSLCD